MRGGTPLFLLARNNVSWVAVPLLITTYTGLALLSRTPGLDLWADRVTGLSFASLYAGVIAAGFAAYEVARWTPSARTSLIRSPRSAPAVRAIHFILTLLPFALGYFASIAILLAVSLASGTYGNPSGTWLLAILSALLLAGSIGSGIGELFAGRWFAAPIAAVAFYSAFVGIKTLPLPYSVESLFPVLTQSDSVFIAEIDANIASQIIFFVGTATLIALLLCRGARRPQSRVKWLTGACLATVIALAAGGYFVSVGGQYSRGYNSRDYICASQAPVVCVNRGYKAALPPITRQFQQLNARAAGTPLVANRLEQNVEGFGDVVSAGARSVYIEQLGRDDVAFAAYRYVLKYGSHNCGEAAGVQQGIDTWLSGYTGDLSGEDAVVAARKLQRLPISTANSWFQGNFVKYKECSLSVSDLP